MHYVYIIKSLESEYYYTGCTDDYINRFNEHNEGNNKSTKPYKPFLLVYFEACLDKRDAFKREKYLKSRRGKIFLKMRLNNWLNQN